MKNNMKELEELTQSIRSKLTKLMELTDGQILKSLIDDPQNEIYRNSFFIVGWHQEYSCTIENGHIEIGGYVYIINKDFEIIGKEPTFNDVLECLKIYQDETNQDEDYEDEQYEVTMFLNGDFYDDGGFLFNWDLSKLYLKDQDLETIKLIQTLIN